MVSLATIILTLAFAATSQDADAPDSQVDGIRSALSKNEYPWYDSKSHTAKPIWPAEEWSFDWWKRNFGWVGRIFGWFGRLLSNIPRSMRFNLDFNLVLILFIGIVFLVILWLAWYYSRDVDWSQEPRPKPGVSLAMIEGLPSGIPHEVIDYWTEANRRRSLGDYSGAVVYLFAHQLLILDRLRMVNLTPGKTARQIVRSITDSRYQVWIEPSLRLFEAAYYGHRPPSREAFEEAWTSADSLQRSASERGVS